MFVVLRLELWPVRICQLDVILLLCLKPMLDVVMFPVDTGEQMNGKV